MHVCNTKNQHGLHRCECGQVWKETNGIWRAVAAFTVDLKNLVADETGRIKDILGGEQGDSEWASLLNVPKPANRDLGAGTPIYGVLWLHDEGKYYATLVAEHASPLGLFVFAVYNWWGRGAQRAHRAPGTFRIASDLFNIKQSVIENAQKRLQHGYRTQIEYLVDGGESSRGLSYAEVMFTTRKRMNTNNIATL